MISALNLLIKEHISHEKFTACAVKIVHKNHVLYKNVIGLANPSLNLPATHDTFFDLASITKVVVASTFMSLVDSKIIGLDDCVKEITPNFYGLNKEITFRQLLAHTSGLPASFNLYENQEWQNGKEFVLKKLVNTPLINRPGDKVVYSCLGFMLLGYAIEFLTNKRLDEAVNDFLAPLNLSNDIVYKPYEKHRNIAITTYTRPNRGYISPGVVHDGNAISIDEGIAGNAGLFSKCDAIASFGESFLNKTIFSNDILIKYMVSEQGETNGERRGLGWKLVGNIKDNPSSLLSKNSYGHSGFTGTSLWIDPDRSLVIATLTNSVHFYKDKNDSKRFQDFINKLNKIVITHII